MKTLSILAATLAVGVLSAQDTARNARLIAFGEFIQPGNLEVAPGVDVKAGSQIAPGIRFLGQLGANSRWFYELSGRAESSSTMADVQSIGSDYSKVKVTYSYFSFGGAYLMPLGERADVGFHLEGRAENTRCQGGYTSGGVAASPGADASNTFLRPWVRVSLDFRFGGSGVIRPLIGVDGAIALIRTYQTEIQELNVMDNRTVQSMAPQVAFSIYAGVQF